MIVRKGVASSHCLAYVTIVGLVGNGVCAVCACACACVFVCVCAATLLCLLSLRINDSYALMYLSSWLCIRIWGWEYFFLLTLIVFNHVPQLTLADSLATLVRSYRHAGIRPARSIHSSAAMHTSVWFYFKHACVCVCVCTCAELQTRWYQADAFYPFFRGHAHVGMILF